MEKVMAILMSAVVPLGALAADSTRSGELTAVYSIAAGSFVDPIPQAKLDRFALSFEGNAAKELFEAMPGPANVSSCGNPELMEKSRRGLVCVFDRANNTHFCSIEILLDTGETIAGAC